MTLDPLPPRPAGPGEAPRSAELVVVGAGTMGAWTAFWAQQAGLETLLLDAWGAGNPRSSSGEESRAQRSAHGADALYTRWSRQARAHWLLFQEEWGLELYVESGVLWFAQREGSFEDVSAATLAAEGVPHERIETAAVSERWPQIGTDQLAFALYEPEAGALMARRGTQAVTAAFQRAGGAYTLAGVRPGRAKGERLLDVTGADGTTYGAETFVFCCGPWLLALFPQLLGDLLRVTKQDVLYVGPPAGDPSYGPEALPVWVDYEAAFYGFPDLGGHGAKVAPDRYGPIFDPSNGERVIDPQSVRLARSYLARRLPGLAAAPVVETTVCQYETTPDTNFLIDRHPDYENVWLVGGGSGHGFKHGPRIGEYVAAQIRGGAAVGDPDVSEQGRFRIRRRESATGVRTSGHQMADTFPPL